MKKYKSFLFLTVFASGLRPFSSQAIETKAKNAVLMDFETGTFFLPKSI